MTWWRDHALLDDVSEYIEDGKVTNELKLVGLQRDDLHSILTCQATNNNISVPASTSVKLDMHCKYEIAWFVEFGQVLGKMVKDFSLLRQLVPSSFCSCGKKGKRPEN